MRISKWTALWLVWLTVIPLSAKPVIHKASIILTAEIQDWGDGGDTDGTAYIQ